MVQRLPAYTLATDLPRHRCRGRACHPYRCSPSLRPTRGPRTESSPGAAGQACGRPVAIEPTTLSSQSADHENTGLEEDDQRERQEGWGEGIDAGGNHVRPREDPQPEFEPVACQESGRDDPGEAEH